MENAVYSLGMPTGTRSCAIFNSPHSGAEYPRELLERSRLGPVQIRLSEDAFVDELFAAAPACGAPLLAARVPRACLDLNRSPDDLDPALIEGADRRAVSPRIAAGLGVIPRVVGEGKVIIDGKIPLAEAEARIARCWQPYHARLQELIAECQEMHGVAVLFDCHSMPHDALASAPATWGRRPDLILGDRFGASCDRWLSDAAAEIFAAAGFAVARNAPFAGGYITQRYGRPRHGVHALQIEIDRALYMNEARIEPSPDFAAVRARIGGAVSALVEAVGPAVRLAAE